MPEITVKELMKLEDAMAAHEQTINRLHLYHQVVTDPEILKMVEANEQVLHQHFRAALGWVTGQPEPGTLEKPSQYDPARTATTSMAGEAAHWERSGNAYRHRGSTGSSGSRQQPGGSRGARRRSRYRGSSYLGSQRSPQGGYGQESLRTSGYGQRSPRVGHYGEEQQGTASQVQTYQEFTQSPAGQNAWSGRELVPSFTSTEQLHKTVVFDLLTIHKDFARWDTEATTEVTNPGLRKLFMEHVLEHMARADEIFRFAHARGWYELKWASEQDIQSTGRKYEQVAQQLPYPHQEQPNGTSTVAQNGERTGRI